MAISYNWDVNTVDVYPTDGDYTDVIYNVNWILNATDTQVDAEGNPYTASVYGTQVLDTSDLSGFIDFDSVTSAEVQGWVESAMGEEQVQTYKDSLDAQIALLVTPTSVTKTLTT
jgi:thiamine pyrophosphokinase